MRQLMLLAALASLAISSCTAHRELQQLADPADPAAESATATQPQYFKLFGSGAFAPTKPVAAAAHSGVEVTLAGAPVSERAAAAAASAAALGPSSIPPRSGSYERCGTVSLPSAQKLAAERKTQSILRQQARSTASTPLKGGFPPVPNVGVWFHVVSSNDTVEGGNVPDAWIAAQLDVLNKGYAGRVKFGMLGTTRTVEPDWVPQEYYYTYEKEWTMKSTLRRGTMETLNVYILDIAQGGLGWSFFPWWLPTADDQVYDGVVLDSFTLPLAPHIFKRKYNEGDTLTHEVGHWLGLYHTFENFFGQMAPLTCPPAGDKGGDFIADTPGEAEPAYDCIPRDSCPKLPGMDPIHNFMSYTDDPCITEFTPNQFTRILNTWNAWRAGK